MALSYFFRNYGSSDFRKIDTPVYSLKLICVHTTSLSAPPQIFCRTHRKMENVQIKEDCVITECGNQIPGIPVECPVKPEGSAEQLNYHKTMMAENLSKLRGRKHISSSVLFSHLHETLEYEKYKTENENFYDNKGCPKDIFAFTLITDDKHEFINLTYYKLDRKYIDSPVYFGKLEPIYRNYEIRIDLNGLISIPSEKQIQTPDNWRETKPKRNYDIQFLADLPECAINQLHDFLNTYAGYNVSLNTILKGELLLKGIGNYPFEPNFQILDENLKYSPALSHKEKHSSEVYNIYCEKLKIHSYPTLRKLFYKDPFVLHVYSKLTEAGFKDINIINDILTDEHKKIIMDFAERPLFFFINFLLESKSERAAWNLLRKMNPSSAEDVDFLTMFYKTFQYMPDEIKESILRDGASNYNHDLLSKLSWELRTGNIEFRYNKKELALKDEISDYQFLLPKDSDSLRTIGSHLHNCVASYKERILYSECTIVYAMKGNEYRLCIEIRKDVIYQARADRNASPTGEDALILNQWIEKHKLIFENQY